MEFAKKLSALRQLSQKYTRNYIIGSQVKSFFSHMPFDRLALSQAAEKCALEQIDCEWVDSAIVARRTWNEVASKGYALRNLCNLLSYDYTPHNALEDAKAAGNVIICAMYKRDCPLETIIDLAGAREHYDRKAYEDSIVRPGHSDGPLSGKRFVFSGSIIPSKSHAADEANDLGAAVDRNLTKKTTVLCIANTETIHTKGGKKSRKHVKAEKYIASGENISIISETEFYDLIDFYK